jgi:UPF0716 protein FxsA
MRVPLSLIALAFVLAEIATFIIVGEQIGVLGTLGLTVLAMVAGIVLLRHQGVATLARIRTEVDAGRVPARPLADTAVLAVAALLMIVPGFISDVVGIALFIPALRNAFWDRLQRQFELRALRRWHREPERTAVVDLDSHEYRVARESPWRRDRLP